MRTTDDIKNCGFQTIFAYQFDFTASSKTKKANNRFNSELIQANLTKASTKQRDTARENGSRPKNNSNYNLAAKARRIETNTGKSINTLFSRAKPKTQHPEQH